MPLPSTSAESTSVEQAVAALRDEIDSLDHELLKLLVRRSEVTRRLAEHKQGGDRPVRDRTREANLLAERVTAGRSHGLDARFVTQVFRAVIDDSLRAQYERRRASGAVEEAVRVAGLGGEGSYSYEAVARHQDRQPESFFYLSCTSFREIFERVAGGAADQGVVAIENTTTGSITEVYDLLLEHELSIVGEEKLSVAHCLLGVEGTDVGQLKRLYAHPQALRQCRRFVDSLPDCEVRYASSTSAAVEALAGDPEAAAIAGPHAAGVFGVSVLAEGIADQLDNYTRFIFVARKPVTVPMPLPCKTSLVMSTAQAPASLVEALLVFRTHRINLVKLESRPIPDNPWEETFYVDFEGNPAAPPVQQALDELAKATRQMRVLGAYAAAELLPLSLQRPAAPAAG